MGKILFPKNYFEDEIRDDFKIDSLVKRAWAAQLEVIKIIEEICNRHGLQYVAFWGTLLGAVRHKGYIPWDDDFDIAMKRKDYDLFFQYAKEELPDGYVIMTPYDEVEWDEPFSRINNSHSISFGEEFLKEYHGFPFSTGIDIFPYDYIPDDKKLCEEKDTLMNCVATLRNVVKEKQNLLSNSSYHNESEDYINSELDYLERVFDFQFNREMYLDNQLLCLYDQIASGIGSENDKYMTCYGERAKRKLVGRDFRIPAYWFDESVDYPFECTTIRIPKYYELCLSQCYGKNFMIPLKGGAAHDYPFFGNQINILKDLGRYDEVMNAVKKSEDYEEYSESFDEAKHVNGVPEEINSKESVLELVKKITDNIESGNKKTILFNISEMDFYENEDKCIRKVESALSVMKENKDNINLIFANSDKVEEILYRKDQRLAYRYIKLIKNYKSEGWGVYIDSSDINGVIGSCDAYYGSGNEYIKYFMINKKPVMICNIEC